jgi:hypothetical protein
MPFGLLVLIIIVSLLILFAIVISDTKERIIKPAFLITSGIICSILLWIGISSFQPWEYQKGEIYSSKTLDNINVIVYTIPSGMLVDDKLKNSSKIVVNLNEMFGRNFEDGTKFAVNFPNPRSYGGIYYPVSLNDAKISILTVEAP